jgi:chromosome segregation ATPase
MRRLGRKCLNCEAAEAKLVQAEQEKAAMQRRAESAESDWHEAEDLALTLKARLATQEATLRTLREELHHERQLATASLEQLATQEATIAQLEQVISNLAERKHGEVDNHHNALTCPYCNPKGLILVEEATIRQVEQEMRDRSDLLRTYNFTASGDDDFGRGERSRAHVEAERLMDFSDTLRAILPAEQTEEKP